MKQFCFFFCVLFLSLGAMAQQYPPEWCNVTLGGYMYDIQSSTNDRKLPEADFKSYLLNIAHTNLAKQIQVRVQDVADLNKLSVDGRTSVAYSSSTTFSTDVNLKLVETKTAYDPVSGMGYAMACINKEAARNYYSNELTLVYNKVNNAIVLAGNFVDAGFKAKAQSELRASLKHFALVDSPLLWLNIFGAPQSDLAGWQERFNTAEQSIKQKLADLKHGTVICLSCNADIFGKSYPILQNELKGILAADGCSFTDEPENADWVIAVTCSAREHSNVKAGNSNAYFSYIDAKIVIYKAITSQRIYEDEVSVKGSHTFGYTEAAKAGYKEIKSKIGKVINEKIKQ